MITKLQNRTNRNCGRSAKRNEENKIKERKKPAREIEDGKKKYCYFFKIVANLLPV